MATPSNWNWFFEILGMNRRPPYTLHQTMSFGLLCKWALPELISRINSNWWYSNSRSENLLRNDYSSYFVTHKHERQEEEGEGGNGVKIGLLCKWVAGNLIGRFTDKSKRKKEEGQKKTGESQDSLKNAQWSRGKKKNIHLNNSPLSREIFISNKKKYIYISLYLKGKEKKGFGYYANEQLEPREWG